YLCDMCFMVKCPYVPPHPWNVDFPHLMLRAKAVGARRKPPSLRDRVLTSTDTVGRIAGIPIVAEVVNAANRSPAMRKLLDRTLKVDARAPLPRFYPRSGRRRVKQLLSRSATAQATAPTVQATPETRGRVALFATCYGNRNQPQLLEDLLAVFQHNGI